MNGILQFIQIVRLALPLVNELVAAVQQTPALSGNAKLQYVVSVVQQALKAEAGLEAAATQIVPLVEAAVAAYKVSQAAGFGTTLVPVATKPAVAQSVTTSAVPGQVPG